MLLYQESIKVPGFHSGYTCPCFEEMFGKDRHCFVYHKSKACKEVFVVYPLC